MALFSGGLFGSGGKETKSWSTSETNTSQETASELENSLAVFGEGHQITYTDYGAISEASALANTALRAGMEQQSLGAELSYRTSELFTGASNRAMETALDFSGRFGDAAFSVAERALGDVSNLHRDSLGQVSDFGSTAINQVASFGSLALSETAAAREDALAATSGANRFALETIGDLFRDSFTSVTNFVKDLQGESQEQIGSTVTALNTIAREQSKSTDERVAEVATNSMKYVVIGLGVVVVGFGLVFAFKGK